MPRSEPDRTALNAPSTPRAAARSHHTAPAAGVPAGRRARHLVCGLLCLGLAACAGPGGRQAGAPVTGPKEAAVLEQPADGEQAVEGYLRLAAGSSGDLKAQYQLLAVEALLQSGRESEARELLNSMTPLSDATRARRGLLRARSALAAGRYALALIALQGVETGDLEPAGRREALQTAARAHRELGQHEQELRARSALEPLLGENVALAGLNHDAAWQAASLLEPARLQALAGEPEPVLSGWAALALALDPGLGGQGGLEAALEGWAARFPGHPAALRIVPALQRSSAALSEPPTRIALLLPGSGPFARAAQAVREGFLAAWYADGRLAHPELLFYDSLAAPPADVLQQALADGAGLVVGPLQKERVAGMANAAAALGSPGVPLLLLNALDEDALDGEARSALARMSRFEFALSPEDEAAQVAGRMWRDGFRRVLVMRPDDDWGLRIAGAFRARWAALGGELAGDYAYPPGERSLGAFVKRTLEVEGPLPGKGERTEVDGELVEEEQPTWRQDVQAIFLAAYPVQARLIAPQLPFLGVTGIPIYATSHAFPGVGDLEAMRDLQGLSLGEMPWLVAPQARRAELYETLNRNRPGEPTAYQRLYAFGIDAYALSHRLGALRLQRSARLAGQTGILAVGADGRVQREILWGQFDAGRFRFLDERGLEAPLGAR